MNFGQALELLRGGNRMCRAGWNGRGMFIALCNVTGPYTLESDGKTYGRRPYLYMKTIDDELVPWTASQTDILAEDWEGVE